MLATTNSKSPTAFYFQDGEFFCEDIQIEELLDSFPKHQHKFQIGIQAISTEVPATPTYIYSTLGLQKNVQSYIESIKKCNLNGVLGYALKANGNLSIVKELKSFGVEMLVTVSGNEILAGLKAGFEPNKIILNGNGKQYWEIKLAVRHGVILNVDSIFDAKHISNVISREFKDIPKVQVLLRIRPSPNQCDVGVHPYVNTSEKSKFGFDVKELDAVLNILDEVKTIQVVGIHCHLGSCISDPRVYKYLGKFVSDAANDLKSRGINIQYLNVGGGIAINYHKVLPGVKEFSCSSRNLEENEHKTEDFIRTISEVVPNDLKIIIEPGRSLVGDAGILLTKVLGSKNVLETKYLVVDAAMSELIRPCLYASHHQIYPTKLHQDLEWSECDVVGPICESADFLGKNIPIQSKEPNYVAVMDCGAYAASMSSTYNMRPKPTEILVSGKDWKYIRRRDMFEDLISKYF